MPQSIRQIIRRFIPRAVLGARRRWRDRIGLARLPRMAIEAAPLMPVSQIDLAAIWSDPAATAGWARSGPELEALAITAQRGGVNQGDRRALYAMIRCLQPRHVLEIGTHIGASTAHIAAALRDAERGDAPAESRLTTVDIHDVNDPRARPWLRWGAERSPLELISDLGMKGRVRFVTARSLAFLADDEERYDFIFLDGDHSAATVYAEIAMALRRLADGGWILLHDVYPELRPIWPDEEIIEGPVRALRRLTREGAALALLPLGELPWETKRGSRMTSLALLGRR